jgi:hypothetical protein
VRPSSQQHPRHPKNIDAPKPHLCEFLHDAVYFLGLPRQPELRQQRAQREVDGLPAVQLAVHPGVHHLRRN